MYTELIVLGLYEDMKAIPKGERLTKAGEYDPYVPHDLPAGVDFMEYENPVTEAKIEEAVSNLDLTKEQAWILQLAVQHTSPIIETADFILQNPKDPFGLNEKRNEEKNMSLAEMLRQAKEQGKTADTAFKKPSVEVNRER